MEDPIPPSSMIFKAPKGQFYEIHHNGMGEIKILFQRKEIFNSDRHKIGNCGDLMIRPCSHSNQSELCENCPIH